MSKPIRIASRHSALALWQANTIGKMLGCDYKVVEVTTTGDEKSEVSIMELGGIGAFAKEIQVAVLAGEADIAVHSAKDLPAITPKGLELVSVPLRGDVRDVLIGSSLEDLPSGAVIGTGAQRRRAQLSHLRPDLVFKDLRGNIQTRLNKANEYDAIVLANVALTRLGTSVDTFEILEVTTMLPQVAQGAIALEVRKDDELSKEVAARINDIDAFRCVSAERSFLETLGGGCSIPCAAYATLMDGEIWLRAMLSDPKGVNIAKTDHKSQDPIELGKKVADDILNVHGGNEIMEMIG